MQASASAASSGDKWFAGRLWSHTASKYLDLIKMLGSDLGMAGMALQHRKFMNGTSAVFRTEARHSQRSSAPIAGLDSPLLRQENGLQGLKASDANPGTSILHQLGENQPYSKPNQGN